MAGRDRQERVDRCCEKNAGTYWGVGRLSVIVGGDDGLVGRLIGL